jgi:hypothetical protein
MYRVIAIIGASLVLAACSSDSMTFKNPFKIEPAKDTIRFESDPPGAEAKTSTGESCRTPCALAMPADKAFSVTFTLTGFQPDTEELKLEPMGDGTSKLRPNPVAVKLTPVKPVKKKKPVRRRRATAPPAPKPKPKTQPAASTPPAPPPMAPQQQPQSTSPWPASPSTSPSTSPWPAAPTPKSQ